VQDARILIRYWAPAGSNVLQCRLRAQLRTGGIPFAFGMLREQRMVSTSLCIPHGGHHMSLNNRRGIGLGGNEAYPESSNLLWDSGRHFLEDSTLRLPEFLVAVEAKNELFSSLKAMVE